jgi:hypothetical protein
VLCCEMAEQAVFFAKRLEGDVWRDWLADAIFYNRVERAPYWYTLSSVITVIEVGYVLQTGFQMDDISPENQLPQTCNRMKATQQKAKRVSILDHDDDDIMEEAEKHNWLEYDNNNKEESNEDKLKSKVNRDSDEE